MEPAIVGSIIGASTAAAAAAANIASQQAAAAKGNLSASFEIYNGTSYSLVPKLSMHRHGALFAGIEGDFYETPGEIDPRKVEVFSVQNPASTDTIGFVLYQSPIFDFVIGWHLFDQAKIWRYAISALYGRDVALAKLPKTASDWTGVFSGYSKWPNDLIWSGTAKVHDDVVRPHGLKVHGKYVRGEVAQYNGATKLDSSGDPIIVQKLMYGTGNYKNFSCVAYGAAKIMKIYISDTDRLCRDGPSPGAVSKLDPDLEKNLTPGAPDMELGQPQAASG